MVQGPSLPAIQLLRESSTSTTDRIAALKQIKTDIVGHYQRKEANVKHGLIEPLVAILASASTQHAQTWTQKDEATLQAVLVLGTLANGGPAFLQPLMAAGATQVLLDLLSPNAAPQMVTAVLQTLKSLTSSYAALQEAVDGSEQEPPAIFTRQTTETFLNILHQTLKPVHPICIQQTRLVADLVTLAAQDDSTKSFLIQNQTLDALARLLAEHTDKQQSARYSEDNPSQPTLLIIDDSIVTSLLAAVSTIIYGSSYRTCSFFLSAPVRIQFATEWTASSDQRHLLGPRYGFQSHGIPLLPPLHIPTFTSMSYSNGSRSFPAVASMQNSDRRASSMAETIHQGIDPDHTNAVIGWLLVFARSLQGRDRLCALRLLALVAASVSADLMGTGLRSDLLQKSRERIWQLALVAVPMAVYLVMIASEAKLLSLNVGERQESRIIKEEACEVLAMLIEGSKELQTAAADAGAIKHVCPILKKSFDAVPLSKPMWSARSAMPEPAQLSAACQMGTRGLPKEILHAMRCRRSALLAIAALAMKEDINRKAIVDAGVVSCIVDSLKPLPSDIYDTLTSNGGHMTPKDGNTTPVILAACNAARSMSRSVSLLRTSLIDGGLAKPIFDLLSHADIGVQIAATNVCSNLVLEFSPLREEFFSAGVTKILTRHARASIPELQIASLWALKHLVCATPRDMRINILKELGVDWVVSAIQGESSETNSLPSGGGVSVGLGRPNAAGEQVDLLNPSSMDVDEPDRDDDAYDEDEDEDGEVMYDESSSTHYQASQLRSTLQPPPRSFNTKKYLSTVKEMECNTVLKAKRDDEALQEQALDFVRNLLNGTEECEAMLEHILDQIGTAKFFDLLTAKLTPLQIQRVAGRPVPIHNTTELILAAVHVMVHVANASPKHRQLLISQKPLLQVWVPHFSHVDKRVRVLSLWAINSLTTAADGGEKEDSRVRMRELRAVGIDSAVRSLANDPELDVRERVKTAVRQLDGL